MDRNSSLGAVRGLTAKQPGFSVALGRQKQALNSQSVLGTVLGDTSPNQMMSDSEQKPAILLCRY